MIGGCGIVQLELVCATTVCGRPAFVTAAPFGPYSRRQIAFTATSGASSCNGSAVLCSVSGVRRNSPPPACAPFNSTGVTRPALTCI